MNIDDIDVEDRKHFVIHYLENGRPDFLETPDVGRLVQGIGAFFLNKLRGGGANGGSTGPTDDMVA